MFKWLKQLFCNHKDVPKRRKYGIVGYVYQCPKCGQHRGYSKEYDKDIKLSQKSYNEYIKYFCESN